MLSSFLALVPAVFFAGMGVYGLAVPDRLLALFGLPSLTIDARNEVRAVYGGFGLAVAGLLGYAGLVASPLRVGILVAVAAAIGGMAIGRVIGAILERPQRPYPVWLFLGVELIVSAMLFAAARTHA
jgi:hypothetical protein